MKIKKLILITKNKNNRKIQKDSGLKMIKHNSEKLIDHKSYFLHKIYKNGY